MSTISANGATSTIYIRRSPDTGNVEYAINAGTWTEPTFPVQIQNTNGTPAANVLKVIITTSLTFTGANQYFDCSSNGIQIGSQTLTAYSVGPTTIYDRANIIIDSVANYPGLIRNGTVSSSGFNNIYVYNLIVAAENGSTLASDGGWVGQQYFGKGATNNVIINCFSNGNIPITAGGIVGSYGYGTIRGCYSTGAIGIASGGITGPNAGANGGGSCIIEQCWSTGAIGNFGGGICGASAGSNGGSITVRKCYSTGIIGQGVGGIAGSGTGTSAGSATIDSCYSTGAIGTDGGGIYGGFCNNITATNCYTTGAISTTGGGIIGASYNTATAFNCYATGATAAATGYIFAGSATVGPPNAYSNGWVNATANTALTGTPPVNNVGTIWVYRGANQPYELVMFGPTPYSTGIIVANALVQNYAQSVVAGGSAKKALNGDASGNNYRIVGGNGGATITINVNTGVISTTSATASGTYTIYVRSVGSYRITTFTLTVEGGAVAVPCCAPTIPQPMLPYDTIEDNTIGNLLVQERARKPTTQYTTYTDYIKYVLAKSANRA